MSVRRVLFPSLLVCTTLALVRRLVSTPTVAEPVTASALDEDADSEHKSLSDSSSYDALDAYVERERRRLKIPGVSLAIVAGDEIVHRRGFGRAHSGGEPPTPQTPFLGGW